MKLVYHGSPLGGLSVIEPAVSTHGGRRGPRGGARGGGPSLRGRALREASELRYMGRCGSIHELVVEDALRHLAGLAERGLLRIYRRYEQRFIGPAQSTPSLARLLRSWSMGGNVGRAASEVGRCPALGLFPCRVEHVHAGSSTMSGKKRVRLAVSPP